MAKDKIETTLKYNTTLQRFKREAEANKNFGDRKGSVGKPLFHKYPPEVRKLAWEHLSSLCIKHKDKLKAKYGTYYGALVATATRLALDELGITQISRKGFNRRVGIARLEVRVGIRDKREGKWKTFTRNNASSTPSL